MRLFVGDVKMFRDKTVASLRSIALVVYLVRVLLFNFRVLHGRWLVENGHTLVLFFLVSQRHEKINKWEHGVRAGSLRYWFCQMRSVGLEGNSWPQLQQAVQDRLW